MSPLRLASLAQGRQPARRLARYQRHVCLGCRQHPARFRYRAEVRADRDHTLCFRCYRAEVNRQRAMRMAAASLPPKGGNYKMAKGGNYRTDWGNAIDGTKH